MKPLKSSRVKSIFASLFPSSLAALESSVPHLLSASSGYGLVSKVYTGKDNGVVQTCW